MTFSVDFCSSAEATYLKPRNLLRPLDLLIIDLECVEDVGHSLFLKIPKKAKFRTGSPLIITSRSMVEGRLIQLRDELAICTAFNKTSPLKELLCLVADLPPSGGICSSSGGPIESGR